MTTRILVTNDSAEGNHDIEIFESENAEDRRHVILRSGETYDKYLFQGLSIHISEKEK